MSLERLSQLFYLYTQGKASRQEEEEFLQLASDSSNRAFLEQLIDAYIFQKKEEKRISEEGSADILQAIFHAGRKADAKSASSNADPLSTARPATIIDIQDIDSLATHSTSRPRTYFLRRWGWVAASTLLLLAAGAYFALTPAHRPEISDHHPVGGDIAPGSDGAILTLADGTTILLDSLKNGTIASQQGANVMLKNGQLVYSRDNAETHSVIYNVVTTPKGKQFRMELSDGTKVWLNSASSIKYPTHFTVGKRRVKITGEAYFEVAKNKKQPFLVDVDGKASVEVLGTEFNVNSYADDATIKTTLIKGSVRMSLALTAMAPSKQLGENNSAVYSTSRKQSVVLKPGQQAQTQGQQQIKMISGLNINQVIAWKNGFFDFNNVELYDVLRQLERWYDIEIKYTGKRSGIKVKGKMYRDVNLSDVLEVLNKMGLSFDTEGRTIIVRGDPVIIPSE
ncbi:MAG TPA: FecR family protein [Chryseolinea sp.]|nr:FecR family protein [Chryseolinea sp.]